MGSFLVYYLDLNDAMEDVKNAPIVNQGDPVFKWIAPEYIQSERGVLWYVFAGVIIAALMLMALIQGSWTMALVIIAVVVAYWTSHGHKPRLMEVVVTTLGIAVGGKFYPYTSMMAFWIIYSPPEVKTLTFRIGHKIKKDITVQLMDKNPVPLRTYLSSQIKELEGREESLSDIWIRALKL